MSNKTRLMQATTFVTIAHEIDYELLKIQARSFSLYGDPSLIKSIIVVENFTPGKELDWRAELLSLYGRFAERVRFVSSADLIGVPKAGGWWTQQVLNKLVIAREIRKASGWWTQQALKLVIAKEISTEWYITLDAKNHFT
jgi:hypothetical protein